MITSRSTDETFATHLAHVPTVAAALDEVHVLAWDTVDGEMLAACRLRVAMLLGVRSILDDPATDAALRADLERWTTADRFDDATRAALAFTEQFVIDVAGIDDACVATLSTHLGPAGLLDFVNALLVVEQRIRLESMWQTLFDGGPDPSGPTHGSSSPTPEVPR